MNIHKIMQNIGKNARLSYSILAIANDTQKSLALNEAADAISNNRNEILAANAKDMTAAKEKDLSNSMLDRLLLDDSRIDAMQEGLCSIAKFPNPVSKIISEWHRPSGLHIKKISVPLGVIGIIYESRPNVTVDAGALCIKSGNSVILRGGSESFYSSNAIANCLHIGLEKAGLPKDCVQLIPTIDRAAVGEMLIMNDYIDVIIPRGGKSLTKRIASESHIPTIQHLDGNCHIYIHKDADIDIAAAVVQNAKLRRTAICGAVESLLIDVEVLPILSKIIDALGDCEIRGDVTCQQADSRIISASDDDWTAEYLDKIISIKIVAGVVDAAQHINKYGSHHTDAIITTNNEAAAEFIAITDSAIVMRNTSTQFADGGEFGMGAEIGISTGRLHARGPVGVEQLTTYKYVVDSDGAIRK